jgi:hypothetical protein
MTSPQLPSRDEFARSSSAYEGSQIPLSLHRAAHEFSSTNDCCSHRKILPFRPPFHQSTRRQQDMMQASSIAASPPDAHLNFTTHDRSVEIVSTVRPCFSSPNAKHRTAEPRAPPDKQRTGSQWSSYASSALLSRSDRS